MSAKKRENLDKVLGEGFMMQDPDDIQIYQDPNVVDDEIKVVSAEPPQPKRSYYQNAGNEHLKNEFIQMQIKTLSIEENDLLIVSKISDLEGYDFTRSRYICLVNIVPNLSLANFNELLIDILAQRPDVYIIANIGFANNPMQSYKGDVNPQSPILHNIAAIRNNCKWNGLKLMVTLEDLMGTKWCTIS